jgi:E3 ubiquitin-protein ligase synoviolin
MHGEQPDGAAAVPAAANPVPVPVDQQQLGFGFGFGRRPPNPPQFNLQNVQLQILQIEHQILQEINGLMTTAEQLNLVRQLQGELARLRAGQPPQNLNQNQAQAMHNPDYDRIYVPPAPNPNPGFSSIQRHYTAYHPGVTTMGAGDTRLPEGLTLPQGWSLLPLQRAPPTTMVGANPHLPHLQQQQHLQTGQSSTTSSQPGGAGVLGNPLHQTTVAPDENSPNLHQQTSPPPATGGVEEQAGVTSSASTMDSKARPGSGGNSDAPEESSILGESSSASTSSAASSSSSSSSSSKGKSREATVEDADGE